MWITPLGSTEQEAIAQAFCSHCSYFSQWACIPTIAQRLARLNAYYHVVCKIPFSRYWAVSHLTNVTIWRILSVSWLLLIGPFILSCEFSLPAWVTFFFGISARGVWLFYSFIIFHAFWVIDLATRMESRVLVVWEDEEHGGPLAEVKCKNFQHFQLTLFSITHVLHIIGYL